MKINLVNHWFSKIFWVICGFFLFVSLSIAKEHNHNQWKQNCFPKDLETYEVTADVPWGNDRFILVEYFPNPQDPNWPKSLLIKNPDTQCQWVMGNREILLKSKTQFVPVELARQIMVAKFQTIIDQKGKEHLAYLYSDQTPYYWDAGTVLHIFPEEEWALNQLGVEVSDLFEVKEDISWDGYEDPTNYID